MGEPEINRPPAEIGRGGRVNPGHWVSGAPQKWVPGTRGVGESLTPAMSTPANFRYTFDTQ